MALDAAVLRALFDRLPDPVVVLGRDYRLIDASASVERLLGWSRELFVDRDATTLVHPDDLQLALISLDSVRDKVVGNPLELRVATADGGWRYVEVVATAILPEEVAGQSAVVLCLRDTTQRRWNELASDSVERFRLLVQHAAGLLFQLDEKGVVAATNGAWGRQLGHDLEDVVGTAFTEFVVTADRARVVTELARAATSYHPGHVEARLIHADGVTVTPYALAIVNLVDDPIVAGYVVTAHDITALDDARRTLEHLATHDPLTGLPNRILLSSRLRELLLERDVDESLVALLFIDLDGFKEVNDALGHHAGDEVLVRLAERLVSTVRGDDLVARLGGDEFVVVCRRSGEVDVVLEIEDRCTQAIERPFMLGSTTVRLRGSAGVVVAGYGDTPDSLLARADRAMYLRKRERRRERA